MLRVVDASEAAGRPVLGFTGYPELQPFSTGSGHLNLLCGRCRFVLVAGANDSAEWPAPLIRCPACGECNDAEQAAA